jgi:hypothetical protein
MQRLRVSARRPSARPRKVPGWPAVAVRYPEAARAWPAVCLRCHKSGRITTHYSQAELESLIEAANKVCALPSRKTPALVLLRKKTPGG